MDEAGAVDGGVAPDGPSASADAAPSDVADATTGGEPDAFELTDCDDECDDDEVCVEGQCRRARDARGCDMCPCEFCEDRDAACCMLDGDPMCVEGSACPPQ